MNFDNFPRISFKMLLHFVIFCAISLNTMATQNKIEKSHKYFKNKHGKASDAIETVNKIAVKYGANKSIRVNQTDEDGEELHKGIAMNIFNSIENDDSKSENVRSSTPKDKTNRRYIKELRSKRGITQLYNMVSCATGCDPLSYKGYGCYCGFLGSGETTDNIDRCCMYHDLCYDTVSCPAFFVYFVPYLWKCHNGFPLCAINNFDYGIMQHCAEDLCECDRKLALCLSFNPCPMKRAICTSSPLRFLQNIIMY